MVQGIWQWKVKLMDVLIFKRFPVIEKLYIFSIEAFVLYS